MRARGRHQRCLDLLPRFPIPSRRRISNVKANISANVAPAAIKGAAAGAHLINTITKRVVFHICFTLLTNEASTKGGTTSKGRSLLLNTLMTLPLRASAERETEGPGAGKSYGQGTLGYGLVVFGIRRLAPAAPCRLPAATAPPTPTTASMGCSSTRETVLPADIGTRLSVA